MACPHPAIRNRLQFTKRTRAIRFILEFPFCFPFDRRLARYGAELWTIFGSCQAIEVASTASHVSMYNPRQMAEWKRPLLIGVGWGLGTAVGLALVVGGFLWYQSRPKPPKPWNTAALAIKE